MVEKRNGFVVIKSRKNRKNQLPEDDNEIMNLLRSGMANVQQKKQRELGIETIPIESHSNLPSFTKMFFWRYLDESEAMIVLNNDEIVLSKLFQNCGHRKECQRNIIRRAKSKGKKAKKLSFLSDRKYFPFIEHYESLEEYVSYCKTGSTDAQIAVFHNMVEKGTDASSQGSNKKGPLKANSEKMKNRLDLLNKGAIEFLKMLRCCGNDENGVREMLRIISALWSGYFFYPFLKKNIFICKFKVQVFCAPIVLCSKRDCDFLMDDMAASVIPNIEKRKDDKSKLVFIQPSLLPTFITDSKIIDSAYIATKYDKKIKFPPQYRNEAVSIKGQFYSRTDLLNFQKRNYKTSLLLSAATEGDCIVAPIILDAKTLQQYNYCEGWDRESVSFLSEEFITWLIFKSHKIDDVEERKQFRLIAERIEKHNQQRGSKKIRGLHAVWLQAQIRTMQFFLDFCNMQGLRLGKESNALLEEWTNLLLEEKLPERVKPISKTMEYLTRGTDASAEENVKNAMKAMVTDGEGKFVFVPKNGLFTKEENIIGYVRTYTPNRINGGSFPALQIREDTFTQKAEELLNLGCDWNATIKAFRKKKPSYLFTSIKTRMPADAQEQKEKRGTCSCLIFKIEDMDFLSDEQVRILERLFPKKQEIN